MYVRRAAGAVALGTIAPLILTTGIAFASPGSTSITAKPTDRTPASGQTFRVNGTFTLSGKPASHHIVKFQSLRNNKWIPLTGARMLTTSTGTYTMRLILSAKGTQDLRAVGVSGNAMRNAFKRFTVTVH
ncbi:MAG: hypothetical protein ACRDPG_03725 [Nocardioidaceae bacterium]